jgi:RNA polymerase sigma factor (sigma-70 family)
VAEASSSTKTPDTSVDLLSRARRGEEEALDRLCRRHRGPLRRWARGRLPQWARDVVDTDDLVQDTLLHTVRRIDDFEPRHDGALQAYLRQALKNRLRDEIRRRRRAPARSELDSGVVLEAPSPLEETVGLENLERYDAALDRLREEDRELIVLRIEMGLEYDEVAQSVGKPSPNAARMAVMRALVRLGEEIARGA